MIIIYCFNSYLDLCVIVNFLILYFCLIKDTKLLKRNTNFRGIWNLILATKFSVQGK